MPRESLSLFHRIESALETIALGSTPLEIVQDTDGVTEAKDSDDEEYGVERLIHAVRTNRHHGPAALVDRIFTDVAEFSPQTPPADDQTVVVLKRRLPELEEEPA
jgi:sigma-B regulation protein RsbU (phosphoserine phosphatase)